MRHCPLIPTSINLDARPWIPARSDAGGHTGDAVRRPRASRIGMRNRITSRKNSYAECQTQHSRERFDYNRARAMWTRETCTGQIGVSDLDGRPHVELAEDEGRARFLSKASTGRQDRAAAARHA